MEAQRRARLPEDMGNWKRTKGGFRYVPPPVVEPVPSMILPDLVREVIPLPQPHWSPPSPSPIHPTVLEREHLGQLPQSYGDNRMVLLARDPYWLFCYWDLDRRLYREGQSAAGGQGRMVLRLYDLDVPPASPLQEHMISDLSGEQYLRVNCPGHAYRIEMGMMDPRGLYEPLASSNQVASPAAGISPLVAVIEATFPLHVPLKEAMERMMEEKGPEITPVLGLAPLWTPVQPAPEEAPVAVPWTWDEEIEEPVAEEPVAEEPVAEEPVVREAQPEGMMSLCWPTSPGGGDRHGPGDLA